MKMRLNLFPNPKETSEGDVTGVQAPNSQVPHFFTLYRTGFSLQTFLSPQGHGSFQRRICGKRRDLWARAWAQREFLPDQTRTSFSRLLAALGFSEVRWNVNTRSRTLAWDCAGHMLNFVSKVSCLFHPSVSPLLLYFVFYRYFLLYLFNFLVTSFTRFFWYFLPGFSGVFIVQINIKWISVVYKLLFLYTLPFNLCVVITTNSIFIHCVFVYINFNLKLLLYILS